MPKREGIMPKTARDSALHVLRAVEAEGAYANLAMNKILGEHRLSKLDRAFATELGYGSIRTLNTLDWILSGFLKKPLSEQTVWTRNILRLAVYQIFYMDKVPAAAACNEAVEQTKRFGSAGEAKFVNGVLRNIIRSRERIKFPSLAEDPVDHIALKYSHPIWLVERWLKEFGLEDTIALCRADNAAPPNTVRVNTLRVDLPTLVEKLRDEGVSCVKTRYAPEGLEIKGFPTLNDLTSFREGLFVVQDESSMLVGHAVGPSPGMRVIDVCSAPGGKTTHLAQLMRDQGTIIASDIYPHKLRLVIENCQRLGIKCVQPEVRDARELSASYAEWVDCVLVDAPCSGLGVLRRRPDARWRKEPEQIPGLINLQEAILAEAARCVRLGGVLVYSTCSITDEENLGQVQKFLAGHPHFRLEDLNGLLPAELADREALARGYVQLLPHLHGTDGFFIARMRRHDRG